MTEAYRYVTVPTGGLLGMLVPVFNCLVGMVIFAEDLSLRAVLGAAVVLGACAVVIVHSAGTNGAASLRRAQHTEPGAGGDSNHGT